MSKQNTALFSSPTNAQTLTTFIVLLVSLYSPTRVSARRPFSGGELGYYTSHCMLKGARRAHLSQ